MSAGIKVVEEESYPFIFFQPSFSFHKGLIKQISESVKLDNSCCIFTVFSETLLALERIYSLKKVLLLSQLV